MSPRGGLAPIRANNSVPGIIHNSRCDHGSPPKKLVYLNDGIYCIQYCRTDNLIHMNIYLDREDTTSKLSTMIDVNIFGENRFTDLLVAFWKLCPSLKYEK